MSKPWERQPSEPPLWYGRFTQFRLIGPERSLEEAFRRVRNEKHGKTRQSNPSWQLRAAQWHWIERAAAWDAEQVALQEQELARARAEWKGKERRMAEQLIEKATQMLAFPVAQRRVETETGVTIVEPGDWRFADVARIADVASKLARLAMEMATAKEERDEYPGDPTARAARLVAELNALSATKRGEGPRAIEAGTGVADKVSE